MDTTHRLPEERATTLPATPRRVPLTILVLTATFGGFIAAAALTAPLAPDLRLAVGEWGALGLFLVGAIPLAVTDAHTQRLPNRGTLPLAAALAGYWLGLAVVTDSWPNLVNAIVCAAVITAITFLIGMVGTLAFGDIKLMIAIGLLTGWISWLLPLYALLAGYVFAIPHAAVLLARKRHGGTTHLPFGPYLVAGATATTAIAVLATQGTP